MMQEDSIICEMNNHFMQMTIDDVHSLYRLRDIEKNKMVIPPQFINKVLSCKSYADLLGCDPTQITSCIIYIVTFEYVNKFLKNHPDAKSGDAISFRFSAIECIERFLRLVWDKVLIDIPKLMAYSSVITELHNTENVRKIDDYIQRNIKISMFRDDAILATAIEGLETAVIDMVNGKKMSGIMLDGDTKKTIPFDFDEPDNIGKLIDGLNLKDIPESMRNILRKLKNLRLDDLPSDDSE